MISSEKKESSKTFWLCDTESLDLKVEFSLLRHDNKIEVPSFVIELPKAWLDSPDKNRKHEPLVSIKRGFLDCELYFSCQILSGSAESLPYLVMDLDNNLPEIFQSSLSVWLQKNSRDSYQAIVTCRLEKRDP
ncbi:MAG: hypothetical protein WCH11_06385 [Bdellovibrio sp.]